MATDYKKKYPNGACSYAVTVTDKCNITLNYDLTSKVLGSIKSGDSVTIVCFSSSVYRARIKKGNITGWVNTSCLKNKKASILTLTKQAVNNKKCNSPWQVAAYVIDGHEPTASELEDGAVTAGGYYGGVVTINCTLNAKGYVYTTSNGSAKVQSDQLKKGTEVTLMNVTMAQMKTSRARVKLANGKIGWINISLLEGVSSGKSIWSMITTAKKENGVNTDAKLAAALMKTSADAAANSPVYKKTQVELINVELNRSVESGGSGLYTSEQTINATTLMKENLASIYGIPYQFHPIIDQRTISDNNAFGRKYGEKIVANMSLLLITPGRPSFMPHYNKSDTNIVFKGLINGKINDALSEVLYEPGRYYELKYAYAGYFKFVDPMLHTCAKFLGIENVTVNISGYSAKLKDFHWINVINGKFKNFVGAKKFIGFYLDSQDQISESLSTSTTESMIASSVNGLSDMAKEVQFLLGSFAGKQLAIQDQTEYQKGLDKINNIIDRNKILKGGKLFKSLGEAFSTVAAGGRMYFPEIWQDSEYSKSYDISMKFRCPDPNPLAWYIDICVPLIHLWALAAPQTMGPNGYASPFLVRACYKGIFNVDMGIITSLDISKGGEGKWTLDGLPTEVDVQMTIKDLYSVMSIIDNDTPKNFLKNTAMIDYLANTCALNINKEQLERSIDLYMMLYTDKIKSIPNNNFTRLEQSISNKLYSLYTGWIK